MQTFHKAEAAPVPSSTATALVRRALANESAAVSQLLAEIAPVVRRTCRRVMGATHPDLEDMVQESLVSFIQALPSYRFEGDVMGYAHRIAFRTAVHEKQRSGRWRRRFLLVSEVQDFVGDFSTTPVEEQLLGEQRKAMDGLFGKLSRAQTEALVLRAIFGLSVNEIASIYDAPLNTIKTRLKLGRETLRHRIERRQRRLAPP